MLTVQVLIFLNWYRELNFLKYPLDELRQHLNLSTIQKENEETRIRPTTSQETIMSLNIALHTTQIPHVTSPHQEIIAIIDLTPNRATELLELMNDITLRACASSRTFKISSFEPSALYVPAYALLELPSPHDFVILPPDYSVTAVTPIKLVHTNIMPLFVNWTASDENERFIVNTAELDAEILKLVARGEALQPGSTSRAVKNGTRPSNNLMIIEDYTSLH